MKPEVKAQLIIDLRSGKYRQAHGVMRDTTGAYCCHGVLTEQARRAGIALVEAQGGYSMPDAADLCSDADAAYSALVPLPVVKAWAGLSDRLETAMINWNDRDRRNFLEIADLLEVCDDEGNVP